MNTTADPIAQAIIREARLVEAKLKSMEWQPIETAPNNEAILVAYDQCGVGLIEAEENDFTWTKYEGGVIPGIHRAKYWMPVPRAPKI